VARDADVFDLVNVAVTEFLGPAKEVYAQEHAQSDIGIEADQYGRWPMSSRYTSSV